MLPTPVIVQNILQPNHKRKG